MLGEALSLEVDDPLAVALPFEATPGLDESLRDDQLARSCDRYVDEVLGFGPGELLLEALADHLLDAGELEEFFEAD